jgi:hypothetical protein
MPLTDVPTMEKVVAYIARDDRLAVFVHAGDRAVTGFGCGYQRAASSNESFRDSDWAQVDPAASRHAPRHPVRSRRR